MPSGSRRSRRQPEAARCGEAARLLEERLAADGGVGALGEPLGVAPLLVEAWTGLGRQAEAAALAGEHARVSA
jgi:hypothetical protein